MTNIASEIDDEYKIKVERVQNMFASSIQEAMQGYIDDLKREVIIEVDVVDDDVVLGINYNKFAMTLKQATCLIEILQEAINYVKSKNK